MSAPDQFLALEQKTRVSALKQTHPLYQSHAAAWQVQLDGYDASGGFLNGGYLWRFPRERDSKFRQRQAQARYHNYLETLVDIYVRTVFGQNVSRTSKDERLTAFWADVDGKGTAIGDFLQGAVALALASGHVGILTDREPALPTGPSRADEQGQPFLALYPPTSILDWRVVRDDLQAVKLAEAVEPDSLAAGVPDGDDARRYLVWDRTSWARFGHDANVLNGDPETRLGLVPLSLLRPKRSRLYPFLGKPLVNANVIRALYNRASEEDDVLRNQAFSLYVVEVAPTADPETVEKVKGQLGEDIGTTSAHVIQGTANFKTPDMNVPGAIRANQAYLVQEVYRMAHLRFERNSLEAETAEAIRLQHQELNQMLVGLAGELTRVEREIARHLFAWLEPTPEAAQTAFDKAEVSVTYPREFFLHDLETELRTWAESIRLSLGDTFTKRVKQRAIDRLDPDADQKTRETMHAEVEALKAEPVAAVSGGFTSEALRANAQARLARFQVGGEAA